jgi:alcohol dehydrogenase class IV
MISGITLANAGLGTVHGLAGPIGGLFKIPHGVVCGTLLAEANRVNIEVLLARDDTSIDMVAERIALHKYATISEKLGFAQQSDSIEIKLQALIEGLRGWVELMKIPKLSQFGVAERDLNMILSLSDQKANPIKLTQAEFAEILRTRW